MTNPLDCGCWIATTHRSSTVEQMAARWRVRISRHPHACQRARGGANRVARQVQTARAAAGKADSLPGNLAIVPWSARVRDGVAVNDLRACAQLSQLPGTTRVLARARSACTVPKDRAKRLVLSRSPAKHPPTGVGRLRPQSTKTCVQHLRACRATRACCATREGRKTCSRQIRTGWLAGVTLGRP